MIRSYEDWKADTPTLEDDDVEIGRWTLGEVAFVVCAVVLLVVVCVVVPTLHGY